MFSLPTSILAMATLHFKNPARVLQELGINSPEQIKLELISKYCGATVRYEPLDSCDGYLVGIGDQAIIGVNEDAPLQRQRFSIGHELGHWMHDRGKVARLCLPQSELEVQSKKAMEKRANQYAKELLMPSEMFTQLADGRDITFATVEDLARTFDTSLTATAIRLIELTPAPALVVCHNEKKQEWLFRSKNAPTCKIITPSAQTIAQRLLRKKIQKARPQEIAAEEWVDLGNDQPGYRIYEDSICISSDQVLTLLWWRNSPPNPTR